MSALCKKVSYFAIICACLISFSNLYGSAMQNNGAQSDNASCLCCECHGLILTNKKHPYSLAEAQAAACFLQLPFGYGHVHDNKRSFPLLELILAYWGNDDDVWLAMHPLTAISDIKISANSDALNNATECIPYVMGKSSNKGPLAKYGVIVDCTIADCYQEPLINKYVQFTAPAIKKLQNALKTSAAHHTVAVTSLCGHYKVCIAPHGIGSTRIKRAIRLNPIKRLHELWCNPALLAELLEPKQKKRCIIS